MDSFRFHSRFSARSVAAQSALPPPRPARVGMRLTRVMRAPRCFPVASQSSAAARSTRFFSPEGAGAPSTDSDSQRELSKTSSSDSANGCISMSRS